MSLANHRALYFCLLIVSQKKKTHASNEAKK